MIDARVERVVAVAVLRLVPALFGKRVDVGFWNISQRIGLRLGAQIDAAIESALAAGDRKRRRRCRFEER